ncbi:hypothetical protein [Fimbriiglobus ruber]|uniref:Uncharacterized protein n=1 Tax=Fimbriiglobus ruber TaxID=1908690 RepID=A0A225DXP6_9BACT|nr:hypothetical protein [Fimbriiglobus ruber]OWK36986.1 hypothetical protein FRUB_07908 [Fimbriiglobus ruber]OWK42496.1 hypothetical protein FRUB_04574 [Fimbriiglobus ruber]
MISRRRMDINGRRIQRELLSGNDRLPGEETVRQIVFLTVAGTALGALGLAVVANVMGMGK